MESTAQQLDLTPQVSSAGVLLSLDLSTTCTGWAKWDLATKRLLAFGILLPKVKPPRGVKLAYPQMQVLKLRNLSDQIVDLIDGSVKKIVIEEINRGKNRLGQKVLDGLHWVLLDRMPWNFAEMVVYRDSDGSTGWRSAQGLGLQLSPADKMTNKERKKFNKKLGPREKKLPIISQKTLACRFVNKNYGLNLNVDKDSTDGDIADAIGLGHFYLHRCLND